MKRAFLMGLMVAVAVMFALPVAAQDAPATLNIGGQPGGLGTFLVSDEGFTLYGFKRDGLNTTNCIGGCLDNWPPYVVESAEGLTVAEGIPGEIGTIEREDGRLQVTYNSIPLYFWVNDAAPGDVTGNNRGTVWYVVPPATVYVAQTADHGFTLVGGNGFTLYTFANDEPGVTTCVDGCAANWPPLTIEAGTAIVAGINIPGIFSTFERPDGTLQVQYNDQPLYYWVNDAARGDTTGHGVRDLWSVAKP